MTSKLFPFKQTVMPFVLSPKQTFGTLYMGFLSLRCEISPPTPPKNYLTMMITLVASQIEEKNMVEKHTIHPIIIIWASWWSMLLMKINGCNTY
jgi:hypothetical protein